MDCFDRVRLIFYERTGIHFDTKIDIVDKKIEKFYEEKGFSDCKSFYEQILHDRVLFQELINLLTVSMSYFFREGEHFEFIASTFSKKRFYDILSLPCAGGEEPYSLVIYLIERGFDNFSILGVDINSEVIQRAREGCYAQKEFLYMIKDLLVRYFYKKENIFCVQEKIKRFVEYMQANLFEVKFSKRFDYILSRNLFIYFDKQKKLKALKRFHSFLKPGGYLILGKSDNIPDEIEGFQKVFYKNVEILQKEGQ